VRGGLGATGAKGAKGSVGGCSAINFTRITAKSGLTWNFMEDVYGRVALQTGLPGRSYLGTLVILRDPTPNYELMQMK
jgi:hypothetical protein